MLASGRAPLTRTSRSAARSAPPAVARNRRRAVAVRAVGNNSSGGNGGESGAEGSDLAYVAKLAALSFAGAAAIKYGSLLVALPHEPSLAVALGAAIGTPVVYSAWLLTRR